ncbi:Conidial development protein fluffy-like protein [Emericellopsis cladophorae]|uniref:Conidial development protein fluffy-like protein n=1 Tax=Emericellopsis cladophorae TaxID=2686198 RepID=A0A9P9Y5K9_9HYPO|nr:Conidial development protein fluffy-like protein [Emericellopsis cladophorae]KAI6783450.1 Conidial development protein fluffy-like protein [Emericellopsis cladophorae]
MYDPRSQNHATFAMNGPGYRPLWQPEWALDVFPAQHPYSPQQKTLDVASPSSARTPPIWDCQGRNMSTTTITASLSVVECQRAMPSTRTRQLSDTGWSAKDAFALDTDACCRPGHRGRSPYKLISMPTKLVLDLTDAFFSWHVGSLPAVQRSSFVSDFLGQRTLHCSPALVRIISCLGCRALGGYDTLRSTYASLGNRLFQEARALIVQSPACVPDVQACGLMALHQLKIGQAGDASDLAEEGVRRMVILMGREGHLEDSGESRWLEYSLCSAVALACFVRSGMADPIGDTNIKPSRQANDPPADDALQTRTTS